MMKVVSKYKGKPITSDELDKVMPKKANWLDGPAMAANTYTEHDPLISDSLGCMKSQVPEMRRMIEREGLVGIKVMDNGQLRITSRKGRAQLIRTLNEIRGVNMHDMDGGYGDA